MIPTPFIEKFNGLVIAAIQARLTDWGLKDTSIVTLERPATRSHGDLSSNIAMISAGAAHRPPREIAQDLIKDLLGDERLMALCDSIDMAGPGFINFFLTGKTLNDAAEEALAAGPDYGSSKTDRPESILLEFVSANPTGPLHVGHARYAAFGDSLRRILVFAGHKVTTEFYINDYGSQIDTFGRSIAARYAQALGRAVDFPEDGYQGEFSVQIAGRIIEEKGDELLSSVDPELKQSALDFFKERGCELALEEIRTMLSRLRVEFDNWFRESSLYEQDLVSASLDELAAAGEVETREGARWLLSSRYGDDKDRVLIRSNGEPTYFASDIAYHRQKISQGYDRLINIWGADHHGYVPRVKAAFEALSHDPEKLEIIIGQLVNVIDMGERKQMSKRAGTMVTLEELLDSIGVDAARFYLVERSNDSTLDLDLEKAKLKSEENPVYYVQYAHARIHSILRRAQDEIGAVDGDAASYDSLEEPGARAGAETDRIPAERQQCRQDPSTSAHHGLFARTGRELSCLLP